MSVTSKGVRTPSGQSIEGKIQSLRTIFSPEAKPVGESVLSANSLQSNKSVEWNLTTDASFVSTSDTSKSVTVDRAQSVRARGAQPKHSKHVQPNLLTHWIKPRIRTQPDQSDSELEPFYTPPSTPKVSDRPPIYNMDEHKDEDQTNNANQHELSEPVKAATEVLEKMMSQHNEEREGPQMIEIKLVHEMFKRLETNIDQKLERMARHYNNPEILPSKEPPPIHRKLIIGGIQRNWEENKELKERIEKLEMNNTNRMAVLSGLYLDEGSKKNEKLRKIDDFFKTNLKFNPLIEDFFKIGAAFPRAKVIIFNSLREKKIAMSRKTDLKGIKNEDGKPYFLNDYIQPAKLEKRKKEDFIIKRNEEKENDKQEKIVKEEGKLMVENEPYTDPIVVPCIQQILDMNTKELDAILAIPICKGPEVENEGNRFIGFSLAVDNLDIIKKAYLKMKICHPRARHIICAFNLNEIDNHQTRNSCDDGEHGAGQKILQMMLDFNIQARVLFVVRYYSGIKIGPTRFDCILQAARRCLELYPNNPILGYSQEIESEMEDDYETNTSQEEITNNELTTSANTAPPANVRQKRMGTSPHNQPPNKIPAGGHRGGRRSKPQRGRDRGGKATNSVKRS